MRVRESDDKKKPFQNLQCKLVSLRLSCCKHSSGAGWHCPQFSCCRCHTTLSFFFRNSSLPKDLQEFIDHTTDELPLLLALKLGLKQSPQGLVDISRVFCEPKLGSQGSIRKTLRNLFLIYKKIIYFFLEGGNNFPILLGGF